MAIMQNIPSLWAKALPAEKATQNKYSRGHTLIVCGPEMTGASRLAAAAARRMGAGLVTIAGSPDQKNILLADAPGLLFHPLRPGQELQQFCELRKVSAIVVGQGLGKGAQSQETVLKVLACGLATVLDAEALTAFAQTPSELLKALHEKCVFTPHEEEFRTFFKNIQSHSKPAATQLAAHKTQGVIVHKGAETIIATSDTCVHNTHGPPFLATAGSGDVLSGLIGGLMSKGMAPHPAACAAVWAHAQAGKRLGFGLIAEDLALECAKALAKHMSYQEEIK